VFTLIVYPDGTDKPGVEFSCANGFVSRVVSAVVRGGYFGCVADARAVSGILNRECEKIRDRKELEACRVPQL